MVSGWNGGVDMRLCFEEGGGVSSDPGVVDGDFWVDCFEEIVDEAFEDAPDRIA